MANSMLVVYFTEDFRMALEFRKSHGQDENWVAAGKLPKSVGHVF